jgi:hypothetical protein
MQAPGLERLVAVYYSIRKNISWVARKRQKGMTAAQARLNSAH